MTTTQKNKLEAYHTIASLLENTDATANIVAFVPAYAAFKAKYAELKAQAAIQARPVSAVIIERNQTLQEAIAAGFVVAGVVLSYADANRLGSLAERVRLRPSDFDGLRYAQRVQLLWRIHEAATSVIAELADRGITAATLDALKLKIEAAENAISGPRRATGERTAATASIKLVIRELDGVLRNQLDAVLLPLEETNRDFYARYKSARMIVDRPGVRNVLDPEALKAAQLVPPADAPATAAAA